MKGVLVDAPGVLESAKGMLQARGVRDRVELVPGSFFDTVPPGADAYILKNVLHDWDDARCRKILGVCRAAMQPGTRLLIVEQIVEEDADHYAVTGYRMERVMFTSTGMGVVDAVAD